jgi:hypothetical protein
MCSSFMLVKKVFIYICFDKNKSVVASLSGNTFHCGLIALLCVSAVTLCNLRSSIIVFIISRRK